MDADTAAEHIRLLHKACLNVACLEAQSAQQGRPCDPSLQPQLRSLTAGLLRSVHPELMTALCSSILQVHTSEVMCRCDYYTGTSLGCMEEGVVWRPHPHQHYTRCQSVACQASPSSLARIETQQAS